MKPSFILVFVATLSSCFSLKMTTQSTSQQNKQSHQELTKRTRILTTHQLWGELLSKHVSNDGKVDYKGIRNDYKELDAYLNILSLSRPNESHSRNYKLAFWINAYNAFTVKLIVRNYPIKSIKEIKQPWDKKFFKIGGESMSLNQIEHEILRNMNEPRIHFAIVCASYSCPKLQNIAFTADDLDTQLTNATIEFLVDKKRNEISENSIKISKIFDWFSKDFTQNGSLIDFLNTYTYVVISPKAKKRYMEYNWALNE